MKLFSAIFIVFCALVALATDVQIQTGDPQYQTTQTSNLVVVVQAESFNQGGSVVLLPLTLYGLTDATGVCTFSNLFGSPIPGYGYYHVSFISTNFTKMPSFDIWNQTTNAGTVQMSTIMNVFGVATIPPGGAAWTAATSDLRYSQTTNQLNNYVLIGQLNTASNVLFGDIVAATNLMTGIVYSNVTAYATPAFVTNTINALAQTNAPASLTTITNIAYQQSTNQGALSTNYTLSASNSLATGFLSALQGTNTAIVMALNASNVTQNANLNTASNALKAASQPASLTLTNLAGTGAFTNILAAGQNATLTTNVSGNTVFVNATNQTFLTNGLAVWNSVVPTSYLQTNVLPALTNGFVQSTITNGLATTAYVNSQLSGLSNTNQYAAGQNASFTTNVSGTIIFFNATNQVALTNHMLDAFANTNQNNIWYDTNGAAMAAIKTATNSLNFAFQGPSATLTNLSGTGALTNALAAGSNMAFATNGSGTIITLSATNQTFLTNGMLAAYATTNLNNSWYDTNGAASAAAAAATNGFANRFQPASQTLTNLAGTGAFTNIVAAGQNESLTTNVSGNTVFFNATNQVFLTNGMLTAGVFSNLNNGWYDTNGSAAAAGTIAINTSTNYANTNTAAQVATALNFASTNTALPFVQTNGGTAFSLSIPDLMILGGHTNLFVDTNYIIAFGGGSKFANAIYHQSSPTLAGTWTNVSIGGAAGSVSFSSGTFSFLSNGVALYTITSIPGAASFTAFGLLPNPYVTYGSTMRDSILVGGAGTYAPDLMAQASSNAFVSSSNFPVGGVVTNVQGSEQFSAAGSNYIQSIVFDNEVNPTNGIGTNVFYALMVQITNNVPMVGVITNFNTNTAFSIFGTNAVRTLVTNDYGVLLLMTNVASSVALPSQPNGFANTNLQNISPTGTNVIISLALGAAAGMPTQDGKATNATLATARSITVTNLSIATNGLVDYHNTSQTNAGVIFFAGGSAMSGLDSSSGSGGLYWGSPNVANQPLLEFGSLCFGWNNDIRTWNHYGVIFGGTNNFIGNNNGSDIHQGDFSSISGGQNNQIGVNGSTPNSGDLSHIGGGYSNNITANYGTIPGGLNGTVAHAESFLWNDTDTAFITQTNQSFVINPSHGMGIGTNRPAGYAVNIHALGANGIGSGNGAINDEGGYFVNGLPIQYATPGGSYIQQQSGIGTNATLLGTNYIGGTYFFGGANTNNVLSLSGYIGTYGQPNGNYTILNPPVFSGSGSYVYTNSNGGGYVINQVLFTFTADSSGTYSTNSIFQVVSNTDVVFDGTPIQPSWISFGSLVGPYYQISGRDTSFTNIIVSYSGISNDISSSVSINTNTASGFALQVNGTISATAYLGTFNGAGTISNAQIAVTAITNQSSNLTVVNTNVAFVSPNITNFFYSTLSVTGCTLYPFLNGSNWVYNATNSAWMQNGANSNRLIYDENDEGFVLQWTNVSADGMAGIWEIASPAYVPININGNWSDTNGTSDTTAIIATNISGTSVTNLAVKYSQPNIAGAYTYSQVATVLAQSAQPMHNWYDAQSNLLMQIICENLGVSEGGLIRQYGFSLGDAQHNQFNVLRLKAFEGYSKEQIISITGKSADSTLTNGSSLAFEMLKPAPYGSTSYARPIYMTGKGHLWLGNTDATYPVDADVYLEPLAYVDVTPSDATTPQFLIEKSPTYSGTVTNGMFWADGTNVWLTASGVSGPILTSGGFGNGQNITNRLALSSLTPSTVVSSNQAALISQASMANVVTNNTAGGQTQQINGTNQINGSLIVTNNLVVNGNSTNLLNLTIGGTIVSTASVGTTINQAANEWFFNLGGITKAYDFNIGVLTINNGSGAGSPSDIKAADQGSGNMDFAGDDLRLFPGKSTGAGTPSQIRLFIGTNGITGTSARNLSEMVDLNTNGIVLLPVNGSQVRYNGNGSGLTNIGSLFTVITNSTQLTLTNLQSCRGTFVVNLAFDDVTGGNPSCLMYSTNLTSTNFFGTVSPNLSGITLVGTVSVTNLYSLPAQTNATLVIVDTSSGGAATRKVSGQVWY